MSSGKKERIDFTCCVKEFVEQKRAKKWIFRCGLVWFLVDGYRRSEK